MLPSVLRPLVAAVGGAVLLASSAFAADTLTKLDAPTSPVVLTVSGKIAVSNSDKGARFDRDTLQKIGVKSLVTQTPWTDGKPKFSGVLLSDLLTAVGAKGAKVKAVALDDYSYVIPLSDAQQYPVLLAFDMDGTAMTAKDKGPIWIVYPRSDFPELDTKETNHRMVWQVKELIIE